MHTLALQSIPITQLNESPHNPRKFFAVDALHELAANIGEHGIITPLTVRPISNGGGPAFEILAGHRRFRAAQMAGLTEAPAIVRAVDDTTAIELLTIDNLQRSDLHPMEEAQGFASLMKEAKGYDVAKIANRCGRSVQYVYDRLKLLRLIPLAQDLFLDNRFTVAHAVILARLTPDLQEIAINPMRMDGLFVRDHGTLFDGVIDVSSEDDPWEEDDTVDEREALPTTPAAVQVRYSRTKPVSVREFQKWVDTHVRLDTNADDLPMLFPAAELALSQADAAAAKVVEITYQQQVNEMAKVGDRIVGPRSWRRADQTCEHAVLGVVVVGPHRGEAFEICMAKKKCLLHWGDEIKAARAAERDPVVPSAQDDWKKRQQAQFEKEQAERKEWEDAQPEIEKAFAAAMKKASVKPGGPLMTSLLDYSDEDAFRLLGKPKTAEDLVRVLALSNVLSRCGYYMRHEARKHAKAFGVDLSAVLKAQRKAAELQAKAAGSAPAKKKGAR